MMDAPPGDNLHYSLEKLYAIGAINPDTSPTETGMFINKFRKINIESRKMILAGYYYGANILDLITIVTMIETTELLGRKYSPRKVMKNAYMEYFIADSFIDLLFLFLEFRDLLYSKDAFKAEAFCVNNYISYSKMLDAIAARDSLIEDIVFVVGFDPLYNGLKIPAAEYNLIKMLKTDPDFGISEIIKIKKCIYSGFLTNLAILVEPKEGRSYYRTINGHKITKMPPGNPRYFIYDKLFLKKGFTRMEYVYNYYSVADNFYMIDTGLI